MSLIGQPGEATDGLETHRECLRESAVETRRLARHTEESPSRQMSEYYLEFHRARLARERAVCDAHKGGLPLDEIARALDCESIEVFRILQRHDLAESPGSA